MEEIEITILNWEKYQNRKDIERPHWFRLQNGLWRDSQFHRFTAEECWTWVCLMSYASEKPNCHGIVTIDPEWFCINSRVPMEVLESSIEKLSRNGCVTSTSRGRHVDVTLQNRTEQYRTEQNNKKSVAVKITAQPTEASLENFVLNLSEDARNKIQSIYPDEDYVRREVEKMKVWLGANPKKLPKSKAGWTRFVMGWLERGWERYRKGLPSAAGPVRDSSDWSYVFSGDKND